MNKNVRKMLSLLLAFVMVFAVVVPVVNAEDNTVLPGLQDAEYRETTGTVVVPKDECEDVYAIIAKIMDTRGNLQGYRADQYPMIELWKDGNEIERLTGKATGPITIDEYKKLTSNIDKDGNILIARADGKAFESGDYELKLDGEVVGEFSIDKCKGLEKEFTVVVPSEEPGCFTLRTVTDGYKPAAEKTVAVGKLKTIANADGSYKYELKEDKTYKMADMADTFAVTTNVDGVANLFDIRKNATTGDFEVFKQGQYAPVFTIAPGEMLGVTPDEGETVYVINPWIQKVDRMGFKLPKVAPTTEYQLNCGVTVNVPYGEVRGIVRVRVTAFDNTPSKRVPIVGAEFGLYKNATALWAGREAGELLAKGVTDSNGIIEFTNVPMNEVMEFLSPDGMNSVKLPFFLKQHSAPVGYFFDDELIDVDMDSIAYTNHEGEEKIYIDVVNYRDGIGGRLAGENRYETAIEIAKEMMSRGSIKMVDGYKTIVLADGHNFADALVGGVLASQYDTALLLTHNKALTEVTKKFIEDENINRVIVLGGQYSVSDNVVKELRDMKIAVERVNGANRAATAVKVGENVIKLLNDGNEVKFNHGFTKNGRVFLAYEGDFADALTASVPASQFGTPILLTATNKLSPETAAALKEWNVREVVIVGGPMSVSEAVVAEVEALGNITVERYHGLNRATTSMELAKHYFHQSTFAYIASGSVFADALTGAPLAAMEDGAPILLVEKDNVPEAVAEYITESNITNLKILGGPVTVSDMVRAQLNSLINPGTNPEIGVSN